MAIIKHLVRVIRWVGELLVILTAIIAVAWAFGAVWFDAPFGNANKVLAGLLAIASAAALVFVRGFWRKVGAVTLLFGGVLMWWLTLSPTNDSDWQADVAQKAWADIQGDEVTLHNVRNCDYRTETDYTPHWETRTVRISQITGIDLAIDYWGSPWIAHPIVSFQFADAPPLCFSIETRKKLGQTYSTIGGLYRQFELIYVVADERDVIRLRTNYRKEDIYLYPTTGCRGIGASCSMAKATNCCMSATSSLPAGFPLASSRREASSMLAPKRPVTRPISHSSSAWVFRTRCTLDLADVARTSVSLARLDRRPACALVQTPAQRCCSM